MSLGLAAAADELVQSSASVDWERLDADTRDATLRLVMDSLGVAAGGRLAPGVGPGMEAYATLSGGDTRLPWVRGPMGAAQAASALSLLVHAWDFDDTHDQAVVHTGSVVLPAALAAAELAEATGQRVLEGLVAGVETLSRLALFVGAQRGVIRTAALGAFGAAAAAARVLGLDAARTRAALALALPMAMAPTSRQVVTDGAISKRHQPGFACAHGLTSAFLARAGVAGPVGWFDGTYGLAALVQDPAAALNRMRESRPWQVTRLSLKPYPACRYTHAAVWGTLQLSAAVPGAADVRRLRVHLPAGSAHELVARPWRRRGQPVIDAQFSVPWLCAAALERGGLGLDSLTEQILFDPGIEERARSVDVVQDQPSGGAVLTPVRVVAEGPDGAEDTVVVDDVPGSPTRPLSWPEIEAKTEGCLRAAGRDPGLAKQLRDLVHDLPGASTADVFAGLSDSEEPHSVAAPRRDRR